MLQIASQSRLMKAAYYHISLTRTGPKLSNTRAPRSLNRIHRPIPH
jgi:hypothetical protein